MTDHQDEIRICLEEALHAYEHVHEDDGDVDEFGDPVPTWVIRARLVLAEADASE